MASTSIQLTASGSSVTANFQSNDTLVITVTAASYGTGIGASVTASGACTASSSSVSMGSSVTISPTGTGSYSVFFYIGGGKGGTANSGTVSGTIGSPSITAPTASSVTFNNPASANTTATVNLSASGSGGTLQYACEVGDTTPDNWQSSNQFTISRGSGTVYARARRSSTTNSNVVSATRPGFLTGDTAVSATSSTIGFSATSASTTLSNATAGETYAVRVNNGGTNLATRTGNGAMSFTSSLPSSGFTDYEIFVRRPTSTGGDGTTFVGTDDTFRVTRTSQDTTPESFTDFTPVTGSARSATITSNSQTITTITGNVSVSVSGNGSPKVSVNGGAFTSSATTISNNQTIQVQLTSSASYSTKHTASVTIGTKTQDFDVTTGANPGSGGSGVGGGTATYGIEVYDTNGTTKVLSPSTRYINIMNTPSTVTIPANSQVLVQQDMTGLTTSNSDIVLLGFTSNLAISVTRLTSGAVSSQGFRLNNNNNIAATVTTMIVRF